MKILLFLSVIFLVGCSGKEYPYSISDFRPELRPHLKSLASEKSLPVKDTTARNYLEEESTKEELIKLLNCDNALLRVVAYRAIVNRNEKDYFEILLGHLNDTTKVTWWYYDDANGDFMVSDLLIRKAEHGRKLSKAQKRTLVDSVLLNHTYLDVSNWMIHDIEPDEKYYALIKERCKTKADRCGVQLGACYALSKFKKKEDLLFLRDKFETLEYPCENWIFRAIENNPEAIYFPILTKYFNDTVKKKKQQSSDNLKFYARAVAAYKNDKSLYLLKQLTDKSNYPDSWYFKYNEQAVFKALHLHKSPIYENLYDNLKPIMSEYVIEDADKPELRERKTW